MSYISISTNQPSNGQRQLTEREPANLRNDFKVPIEINVGDTIELVSLKFNINAIVINENNNRIVWAVGQAPFATYHCALIPFGNYDSPIHLATGIATAFNSSTLLPNYQQQSVLNWYGFTNIPGWTCTWDTSGTVGKFIITANQCESPALKTNGSCANAYYTTLLGLGLDAASSRAIANGISVNNSLSYFAADGSGNTLPSLGGLQVLGRNLTIESDTGPVELDNQVWAQKRWDPTSQQADNFALNMFILATDDTGQQAEDEGLLLEDIDSPTIWFDSETNQIGNNGGYSFETSRANNTVVVESQESVSMTGESSSFLRDMGGIFNNGGRVRAEVLPLMGYKLTDFTTSTEAVANFVGQTLTVNLQKYDENGNSAPVDSTMVCAVVDPATNNGWNITLTTTTPFDATGDGGPTDVTVLWLTYLPDRTHPVLGPLATYENGMWAMGYTVGGGASAPPDANDPSNYNAFADPANGKARNYWYYDIGDGQFKCAYREKCVPETTTAFDEYTRPIRTNFVFAADASYSPPAIFNPATLDMTIVPTQPLGYPACKVGLNRRERFTPDFKSQNFNKNAGFNSLADSTVGTKDDETCEYSISINNGDPDPSVSGIKVDASTGARVPLVKFVCPKPFTKFGGTNNEEVDEEAKPVGDEDWLESHVINELRMDDATFGLAAFDPTKSIFLELKLDKNNVMTYIIAQETSSSVTTANPFPPELPAYTNKYETVIDPKNTTTLASTRLQESHFPLIPTILVGGGGYYGIGTGGLEEHIGAAYKIDMSGPYRLPDKGETQENPRLSFIDAYNGISIVQSFALDTSNRIQDDRKTVATNHIGATDSAIARTTPAELNRENMAHYNVPAQAGEAHLPNVFVENSLAVAFLAANTSGNTGINGFDQINIAPPSATNTKFESENKISFNGIEDGLSVNLLSGNIKGYNGGTSDINKAIAYLQPEQLSSAATGIGSRTFFHQSTTSRPVEFNVPNQQTHHSMTVQLRNNNNELVRGIEAPVEVVLYKRSKDNELQEIRQVLNSIKSDRQGIKIQTAGDDNPLLGVIPR